MKRLIIATGNPGKVREIKDILSDSYDEILSQKEAGLYAEVVEDADSFLGNAQKKALAISRLTDADVVADDSGLSVSGLGGRPGVYSARYSEAGTDVENNKKLVREITPLSEEGRRAHYACAIVLARRGKVAFGCEGRCEGVILTEPLGTEGFGYDPYFYLPAYGLTFGELSSEAKNQISHRAKALAQLKKFVAEEAKKKRVLVVSDTHKNIQNFKKAILQAEDPDYLFCLGDHFSDLQMVRELWPKNVSYVKGNCDFGYAPLTAVERVAGKTLVLTHGHEYGVKLSLLRLSLLAEEKEADAVLFGHTHKPLVEYTGGGRLLFNPGSLAAASPTFGLLEVGETGVFPSVIQLL